MSKLRVSVLVGRDERLLPIFFLFSHPFSIILLSVAGVAVAVLRGRTNQHTNDHSHDQYTRYHRATPTLVLGYDNDVDTRKKKEMIRLTCHHVGVLSQFQSLIVHDLSKWIQSIATRCPSSHSFSSSSLMKTSSVSRVTQAKGLKYYRDP